MKISIPFRTNKRNFPLTTITGLIRPEDEQLVLEFNVAPREVKIHIREISDIEIKKWLFMTNLSLRTQKLSTLDNFPGRVHQGALVIIIANKFRDQAAALASHIQLMSSEIQLRDLDEENN